MINSKKPILLVEDDHVDAKTVQRAFKELKIANKLYTEENGEEALAFLEDKNKPKPCLILLDLKMPKMNGLEFLEIIKNNDDFKRIPVIVLTTSSDEQDKIDSYDLSVAGYIVKPVEYKSFIEVVREIDLYWTISELPE